MYKRQDENYQREISEAIPQLAPQVILLVSKSQGLNAVQKVLLPRIGRELSLIHI